MKQHATNTLGAAFELHRGNSDPSETWRVLPAYSASARCFPAYRFRFNPMQTISGDVQVHFHYDVHFTTDLFAPANLTFRDVVLAGSREARRPLRVLFVVDQDVERCRPVCGAIEAYFKRHADTLALAGTPLLLPGGEAVKNSPVHVDAIRRAVNDTGLDRHSYLAVIGGGALLDVGGFAAATAHRGIRLLRIPTTTLSQNDSGVGVKNGINSFGKKNFTGTFAPPWAVLNDLRFLETLPGREWRAGIAEAVKVALIKDAAFFEQIEDSVSALAARDLAAMGRINHRCAELHVQHICRGGDPFEMGSSRPLDFGHWSAHKLEQLTHYHLRHGEAVAIGLALDVVYSHLQGWLGADDVHRVCGVLAGVGFALYDPALDSPEIFRGLREFREHLGGELTIQMLRRIGEGFNVHEIDEDLMRRSIGYLKTLVLRADNDRVSASEYTKEALATA